MIIRANERIDCLFICIEEGTENILFFSPTSQQRLKERENGDFVGVKLSDSERL